MLAAVIGCGTTRWSDTTRTATEQMLMSDAIERAVSDLDFSALAGKDVYLDMKYLAGAVDEKYVTSTLRQHMFATGCILHEKPEDASYVVEVRAGALGTNRNDVLFGVPATQLPAGGAFIGAPTAIPELPLIKRTAQQGVAKLAVFAYDRVSGAPVWQSGNRQEVSKAKDVWVFGTGPFQHGTIYDGAKFAGERLRVPLFARKKPVRERPAVANEVVFNPAPRDSDAPAQRATDQPDGSAVTPASASTPIVPPPPAAGPPPSSGASATPPTGTVGPSTIGPSSAPSTPPAANGSPSASPSPAASAAPAPSSSSSSVGPSGTSGGTSATSSSNGASTMAASGSANTSAPNAAAGAVGAMQVVDWARTARPLR
jgi:hypothetical protein